MEALSLLMWCSFTFFIEFATVLLLLKNVLVFLPQDTWDVSSGPGIKLAPPALEGEVLTTGLPGKSSWLFFIFCVHSFLSSLPSIL